MAKKKTKRWIVEYSGYTEVEDAVDEKEAIEIANQHLYDLDMVAYTQEEWDAKQNEI